MPLYLYQCDCGVRFEAAAAMRDHAKPQPCPACGAQASRHVPEGVEGVFNQEVTGPGPQNTGVSQIDAHIDRVIGQSAQQGWQVVEQRVADKRNLIRQEGVTGHDLSRNLDGTYRVMAVNERGVHDRAFRINSLAIQTLKARKKETEGGGH